MSRRIKPGRVYVGNLPPTMRKTEVESLFNQYGRILSCDLKKTISGTPFAFIEYDDERDADEAIRARDGYNLDGHRLRVEVPFSGRGGPRRKMGPPQRAAYRVVVSNLPPSGSWQDLKDHLRSAGPCVYAEVFRDGTGIMEFSNRDHMNAAIRIFNGSKFRSHEGEVSRIEVRAASSNRSDRSSSYDYDRRRRSYSRRRRDSVSRSRSRGRSICYSRSRSNSRRSRSRDKSRSNRRSRSYSRSRSDSRESDRRRSRSRSRSRTRTRTRTRTRSRSRSRSRTRTRSRNRNRNRSYTRSRSYTQSRTYTKSKSYTKSRSYTKRPSRSYSKRPSRSKSRSRTKTRSF